jgi:hypothetical protein
MEKGFCLIVASMMFASSTIWAGQGSNPGGIRSVSYSSSEQVNCDQIDWRSRLTSRPGILCALGSNIERDLRAEGIAGRMDPGTWQSKSILWQLYDYKNGHDVLWKVHRVIDRTFDEALAPQGRCLSKQVRERVAVAHLTTPFQLALQMLLAGLSAENCR